MTLELDKDVPHPSMEWMDDTIVSGVDLPHSYTWHNIPQPATQLNQDIGVATVYDEGKGSKSQVEAHETA